ILRQTGLWAFAYSIILLLAPGMHRRLDIRMSLSLILMSIMATAPSTYSKKMTRFFISAHISIHIIPGQEEIRKEEKAKEKASLIISLCSMIRVIRITSLPIMI